MQTWFTADTHFGHNKIIEYCDRPFTPEEMTECLIDAWNQTVGHKDTVYHLGDVMFAKVVEAESILQRLNGKLHLIYGNHDQVIQNNDCLHKYFESISDIKEIRVFDPDHPNGKQGIVLCHYAMRVWNHSHHGHWHLYGHSHGTLPDDPTSLSLDVGVDAVAADYGYRPVSYDEVKQIMWKRKAWEPKDHHGKD